MRTYSTKLAAKLVGVHSVTLLNWIRAGKIRPSRPRPLYAVGTQPWRWRECDIERARQLKAASRGRGRKRQLQPEPDPSTINWDVYGHQFNLLYNGPEAREFRQLVNELGTALGTKNQSDTVLHALRHLSRLSQHYESATQHYKSATEASAAFLEVLKSGQNVL